MEAFLLPIEMDKIQYSEQGNSHLASVIYELLEGSLKSREISKVLKANNDLMELECKINGVEVSFVTLVGKLLVFHRKEIQKNLSETIELKAKLAAMVSKLDVDISLISEQYERTKENFK